MGRVVPSELPRVSTIRPAASIAPPRRPSARCVFAYMPGHGAVGRPGLSRSYYRWPARSAGRQPPRGRCRPRRTRPARRCSSPASYAPPPTLLNDPLILRVGVDPQHTDVRLPSQVVSAVRRGVAHGDLIDQEIQVGEVGERCGRAH